MLMSRNPQAAISSPRKRKQGRGGTKELSSRVVDEDRRKLGVFLAMKDVNRYLRQLGREGQRE